MTRWLRRHARWFAAALSVVLAGGLALGLRTAVSAHAQPGPRVAQVRAVAPPVLAPAARGRSGRGGTQRLISASGSRGHAATAGSPRMRPGVPTPPPSSEAESEALRKVTGLSSAQVSTRSVCARAAAGHASCAAQLLVLRSTGAPVRPHVVKYRSLGRVRRALARGARPADVVAAAAPPSADTPAYLQQAYDLSALSQTAGAGDTIGVVDAYDDPTAASDLNYYRQYNGLPACTTGNGCFRKVGQNGTGTLPGPDTSWEQEISLDLDAVSAVCPNCHILLVEANSDKFSDLQAAMQTAANLGVKQISASWDGPASGVPAVFQTFSGIATVAATGDSGYVGPNQDSYPAALPGVTAAGGTSLAPAAAPTPRGYGESAWSWSAQNQSGGGSGCDLLFARPSYQPAMGCPGRAYADLSADADPQTGLSVYNHGTWSLLGGTSLSTPLIAAYYAITGVADSTPQWAYSDSAALNDVVSGSTGTCASSIAYICNAGVGYDGPTGVGSISGSVVVGAPGIGGPSIGDGTSNSYTAGVTIHGATISAGIYRNGLDTNWSIQYGTTTAYGSQTSPIDLGAGSAPVPATAYLSQLTAGTTYHYRVVAQNSLGTTYGYDYTFTTEPAPAGAPVADFAVTPSAPAPGAPVSFDASASTPGTGGQVSDYSWNWGDGSATQDAGAQAITPHTYTARGTYTVTLTVTSNGQTDSSTQTVTVDSAPTASFTSSATAVPAGGMVSFNAAGSTASAGGQITDYSWNFGDHTSTDAGSTPTTSHTFTTPGTYTVTLTTTDDLDVVSTTSEQITVAPFTVSPAMPAPTDNVTFTQDGSSPPGATYSWNFGDGATTGSGATATHAYTSRGSYTVTLTIQNGSGTTQTTGTVNVDSPPTSAFTPSATAVVPGTSVNFDGSASSAAAGGSIADYSWNFGDGTASQDTGTTTSTSHTFNMPGVYTVTLTTTDDLGATAAVSHQVTVDDPAAAFTSVQSTGTTESFDAAGTSDPESAITDYSWNFGDGTGAQDAQSSPTTSHTFSGPGTYTVTLTVTDQLGLTSTSTQQVSIAPVSTQSSGSSTPPTTPPTPAPPVSPPVSSSPSPPAPSGSNGSSPTNPVVAKVAGSGRQRLTAIKAHGLRLALAVNQRAGANIEITIPVTQTTEGASATHGTRHGSNAAVVLLHANRSLTAGSHGVALKLPRSALAQLAAKGRLVVTVRVTFTGSGGRAVTRTLKITLTR